MTARSIQQVAVDWQVQPGADPGAVAGTVAADPLVGSACAVRYAAATGLRATGPGQALSRPAGYVAAFPAEFRHLTGAHDGPLITQQTAANPHATPGDQISIGRAGLPPATVTVAGIVDLPKADALFQKVGAPAAAQPPAPPDNVAVLPSQRWDPLLGPLAAAHPDQVQAQIHVLTRGALRATRPPAAASGLPLLLGFTERRRMFALLRALGARRRQLAAMVAAEVTIVTLLGAALGAAAAWALTHVLICVLTGVFDPPPDHLSVPWTYLLALAAVALGCAPLPAAHTMWAARRPALEQLREL